MVLYLKISFKRSMKLNTYFIQV